MTLPLFLGIDKGRRSLFDVNEEEMALVLRVLTAGDCALQQGETRLFDGTSFSIGRGTENDWVVSDPQRHLSKQHCRLERRGSSYFVIDTSTNGVYVGNGQAPLGRGNSHPLSDGDTISLGPCILKVEIREAVSAAGPALPELVGAFEEAPRGLDFPMEGSPAAYGGDRTSVSDILGGRKRDTDPMDIDADLATLDGPESDMSAFSAGPQIGNHYSPPEVQRPVIPPDWHADEDPDAAALSTSDVMEEEDAEPADIVRPAFPRPMPRPAEGDPEVAAMPSPPVPAAPVMPAPAVKSAEPVVKSAPEPAPVPQDPVAAFMAGVGLPLDAIENADQAALMHKMGLAFREAVGGLRELLELRAFLKSEFRIEHTLLRAKENNPLKFSANLDGTLAVLIGRRVTGFMDAPEAVRESLRDIKAHEVALIAGMKTVVGDVLEQLSPEAVSADVSGSLLPQVHKARCWEKYEQTHQRMISEQSSGPPLGGKFSAAYTKQFRSL